MSQTLAIRSMDKEQFRPFGELVPLDSSRRSLEINAGLAVRHFDVATLDIADGVGRPFVSVFAARPHPTVFEVEMLERHPLGSQAFFPLAAADWVVIVAPTGTRGEPGKPVAFRPAEGQGVNIGRGVWHYPLVSLKEASFLVIDGGIADGNLEIHHFEMPRWRVETNR